MASTGSSLALVCEEKIQTRRGDIRVECHDGAEYHARSGQLVEERICELLADASAQ